MAIESFLAALGDIPVARDLPTLRRKSRDFYWYSPVLKPMLDGMVAEAVVNPRHEADILRIAEAAHATGTNLTIRGGGTGNYGQAMPLEGGAVVEMTGLDQLLWVRDGVARVQAGMKMLDLDLALRAQGHELRMYPSTKRTATIGGHVAGGFAGVGSLAWGSLVEPGNLLALRVVTAEAEPRVVELRGRACNLVNRTYGTTGFVTELEIPVQPAVAWRDVAVAFPTFLAAARFAREVATSPAIDKKQCAVHEPRLIPFFKPLQPLVPAGHALAMLMVNPSGLTPLREKVADHGGTVVLETGSLEAEADPAQTPLYEYCWNHTTLQVLKQDRGWTYTQALFPAEGTLEKVEEVANLLGEEAMLHLEFIRVGGAVTCSSIPVLRAPDGARIEAVQAALEARGVMVSNPHVVTIEDGSRYKRLPGDQLGFKRQVDPLGLMNPGKMRSFTPPARVAPAA